MKNRLGLLGIWAIVGLQLVLLLITAAAMHPVAHWTIHLALGAAAFVIWWLDGSVGASRAGTVGMAFGLTLAGLGLIWDWGAGTVWTYLKTFKTPLKVTDADRRAMGYTVLAVPAAVALMIAVSFARSLHGREDAVGAWLALPWSRRQKQPQHDPEHKELGDLDLCLDEQTKKPVILKSVDRYMHILICGPTGSGKTAGSLHKMAAQDLANSDVSVTIVEPKGDWVGGPASFRGGAYDLAQRLGRKAFLIDPSDPNTAYFNPLVGDPDIVAEINRTALETLFGDQEAFFRTVASTVIKNIIKLCKYVDGDSVTYDDIMLCLRDDDELKNRTERLRKRLGDQAEKTDPRYALLEWVRKEYLLGDRKGGQPSAMKQHSLGLRVQLEEMMANQFFRRCVLPTTPQAKAVNLEEHLSRGNVLCVSTNDGLLGNLSKVLGILITTHLQYAIQRRQIAGADFAKVPPAAIYMDEFGGYVTTEFGSFLTKARGFKASCTLALQSPGQLIQVAKNSGAGAAFRDTVMGQCRSKVVYGGLEVYDAQYFEKLFGTVTTTRVTRSESQHQGGLSASSGTGTSQTEIQDAMFGFNDIRFQEANHVLYELLRDRTPQRARRGVTRVLDVDKLLHDADLATAASEPSPAPAPEASAGGEERGESAGEVSGGTASEAPAEAETDAAAVPDQPVTTCQSESPDGTRVPGEPKRVPVKWVDVTVTEVAREAPAAVWPMPGAPSMTFNKTSPGKGGSGR